MAALVQVQRPAARQPEELQMVLRDCCRQKGLSGYKIPGFIACQAAPLPANSSGKLVKHKVRQLLQQLGPLNTVSKL